MLKNNGQFGRQDCAKVKKRRSNQPIKKELRKLELRKLELKELKLRKLKLKELKLRKLEQEEIRIKTETKIGIETKVPMEVYQENCLADLWDAPTESSDEDCYHAYYQMILAQLYTYLHITLSQFIYRQLNYKYTNYYKLVQVAYILLWLVFLIITMQKMKKQQTPPTMQSLSEPTVKISNEQQHIARHTLDTNNLYNKLISYNYKAEFISLGSQNQNLQNDIGKLFDEFIWAEKYNPSLLYDLFDMQALQQVTRIHSEKNVQTIMKNHIILMTNASQKGVLAELLLDNKLPTLILNIYIQQSKDDFEQKIEYIGSFIKMYHRMFHPDWLSKFIHKSNYFQLMEIAFKFYNCPELITRTSVLNIIFELFQHIQVRQFFCSIMVNADQDEDKKERQIFYKFLIDQLTKQFRSQLTSFCLRLSHTSKNDDVAYIMVELEDKIAFWQDFSKSLKQCASLIHKSFVKNILLPLLVGPLQFQQYPLFTLKFSLYVIKKLIPTLHSLGLLQKLVRLIFLQEKITYWPSTLNKGVLYPFNINWLMKKNLSQFESEYSSFDAQQQLEQSKEIGAKVKIFYVNIFRSKDNHFLLMISALLCSIIQVLNKYYPLQVIRGLELDIKSGNTNVDCNRLLYRIQKNLMVQLQQPHRLTTVISIIDTLVFTNGKKPFESQQMQNEYIFIMRKLIKQSKQILKSKIQYWDAIIQTLEYDLRHVDLLKFGELNNQKRFEEMYQIVFTWDVSVEETCNQKFYSAIIDTNQEQFRYIFVKFMLMRKACNFFFENFQLTSLRMQYYSKIISKSPYISNDIYRFNQLKAQAFQCQLIDHNKTKIPILFIKDENFLVLAHLNKQQKQIRIMLSIRNKHIQMKTQTKKQKLYIRLGIKDYDWDLERIRQKQPIEIRCVLTAHNKILPCILANYRLCKEKQLAFMGNVLNTTQERLQTKFVSLI